MSKETIEYDSEGKISIVRSNLMHWKDYTPYCGSTCISRTKWIIELNQFKCPTCNFITEFPKEFIDRYKEKWNK